MAKGSEHGLPRLSLHPLTLEAALKRALAAPVEPKEPHKPGAGRKKKQPETQK